MSHLRKSFALVIAALSFMWVTAIAPHSVYAADEPAALLVAHGIPGADLGVDPALPVDVKVVELGACVLNDFEFGQFAGPLELPAGTYTVEIYLDLDKNLACEGTPAITAPLQLESGMDYTAIAHLDADGGPTASLFENDFSPIMPGKTRLVAHHTAYAPAVDITVSRDMVPNAKAIKVTDVANGDSVGADIRPGDWYVAIAPAGGDTPVFGPAMVSLEPFTAYLVYAVGSLENETFTLLIKDMPLENAKKKVGTAAGVASYTRLVLGEAVPAALQAGTLFLPTLLR